MRPRRRADVSHMDKTHIDANKKQNLSAWQKDQYWLW